MLPIASQPDPVDTHGDGIIKPIDSFHGMIIPSILGLQTAFSMSTEEVLIHLFSQIALILAASKCVGAVFVRFGQSRSVGEILTGVMLGPSLFGWLFPAAFATVFNPGGPSILPWFSHIGLILTLFLIGMEFDFKTVLPHTSKLISVAFGSLLAPLLLAFAIAPWLWSILPGSGSYLAYALFLGMTMAITAIPIMGRILMELDLTRTRVGVLAIATGALKDLLTWFLLVIVIGIARPPFDPLRVLKMMAATALLAAFCLTLGRQAIAAFQRRWGWQGEQPSGAMIGFLLIFLLLMSAATAWIGIFAIFGAFMAGVTLSSDRRLSLAVSDRLHDLTIHLFLPIFFTYTGLRCDLSSLQGSLWLAMLAVTVIGSLGSGGIAWAFSKISRFSSAESLAFGFLINTPGLMVLILLNLGLDLDVIPKGLFSVLVGSAMIRNLLVTPVLRHTIARVLPPQPLAT
ncbi:MAG: cation:proton antiporter [Cyanobium sp.]